MRDKKIALVALLCAIVLINYQNLLAQAPAWSVTPSNYDNSMVITAVLQIDGVESRDTDDMVGAFINGEVRGVANPDTYLSGQDRYMAQLIVYSNESNGSITFKLYDNSTGTVKDAVTLPVTFIADGVRGGFESPVIITDNNLPTAINLSNSTVLENRAIGTPIGDLSATDSDNDTFTFSLVNGDGDTDNAAFAIMGNQLQTAQIFNYESKSVYSIRIRTTDNKGGIFEDVFSINILDDNDAPTNITLSNAGFAENLAIGNLIGTLSTTDQDATDTYTYTIVGGDQTFFSINGNQLLNATSFNFEVRNNYTIRVRTTDSSGSFFEKDITISIINANDIPTDMALNPGSVAENAPTGTSVGTLSTTDEDTGDEFTYALVSSAGQNDNNHFIIVNNEVKTLSTFNYESRQLYYINVQVTDGGGTTYTELFTIQVTDANDAPINIDLSDTEIAENANAGTEVATLFTTDPDNADTHTYELVSGTGSTDNDQFIISGNSLLTATSFDYEGTQLYKIRLRSTDNGAPAKSFEKAFVISVTDVNDSPENLQLSFSQIPEDASIGTTIGSFSVSDQDAGDTHQYSLVSGVGSTDNAAFAIVYGELKNLIEFDFETKSTYSIRVQARDADGATTEAQFNITIVDSNDDPTLITISNNNVPEGTAINSSIGTFSTDDPDGGSTFTYSLTGTGNDNGNFVIIGNQLYTSTTFDYEKQAFYFINVTSRDNGGAEITEQIVIVIVDENDAPTDISISNNKIAENEPNNTFIGKLFTTDQDEGDGFTYSLISGLNDDDNALFRIVGNELQSDAIFNYEIRNEFSIRVRSTDRNNAFIDKNFIIFATDRNDLPTSLELNKKSFFESDPIGTAIGSFITTDPDQDEIHNYALVTGDNDTDNARFLVSGNELLLNTQADFETKAFYNIRLAVTDKQGGVLQKAFIIEVKDTNDPPSQLRINDNIITENLPVSSIVGTLETTDPDATEAFVYTLLPDFDAANFYIEGDLLKTNQVFDYESKSVYTVKIQVEDKGGIALQRNFAIVVKDTNDVPSDITLSQALIAENKATGSLVGTFSTVDNDGEESFTYSLVDGINADDNTLFQISENRLLSAATFNFEEKNTYQIRVRTSDSGGSSFEKSFTISIENANDVPTAIELNNNVIEENEAIGSLVGLFSTEDEDEIDEHSYSLVSGVGDDDNASFAIEKNQLVSNNIFDFESKNVYSILVQTKDLEGGTFIQQFTISILNQNEPPVLEDITFRIDEESPVDALVGTVEASDQDPTAQLNYSIVYENDEDELLEPFYIDENSGDILVNNPKHLDYETTKVFFIKVKATNNANLSDTARITIRLNDIIEASELPVNNYVSPNSDGMNDTWAIQTVELYSDFELIIFNDFGEIIFQTTNYQNDWNGIYNGNELPSGVYYYSMRNDQTGIAYKGSITLVR